MISIKKYDSTYSRIWNEFNENSKNCLFMFDRNYMDYHSDRFKDHSLMFYDGEKLVAILPLSEHGKELKSHGGLTYGGFITNNNMKQHIMNECVKSLIEYIGRQGYKKLLYKTIPHIYHIQPAEEDIYALVSEGARLLSIEASTVVNLKDTLPMPKGRKAQIARAKREGVKVEERSDIKSFERFIELENIALKRHNTLAVHTYEELKLLHDRFPNNIHLIVGVYNGEIISGTVLFEYSQIVHTQYMATNEIAKEIGALDIVIKTVIEKYMNNKKWLDFGISTENEGKYLNEGLISQKEGFGGRTNIYSKWEINIES